MNDSNVEAVSCVEYVFSTRLIKTKSLVGAIKLSKLDHCSVEPSITASSTTLGVESKPFGKVRPVPVAVAVPLTKSVVSVEDWNNFCFLLRVPIILAIH